MTPFWDQLAQQLRQGRSVFVAMVVRHTRHSPGTSGAKLWIALDRGEVTMAGTIGGGIMEHQLVERAKGVLAAGEPFAKVEGLEHRRRPSLGGMSRPSGMICAGKQVNLYYLCRPEIEGPIVEDLLRLLEGDVTGVLEIDNDGWSVRSAPADLDHPRYRLELLDHGRFVYREEFLERRRLAIFGGGHCAVALARVACRLGYDVTVVEGPKKSADPELAPHARHLFHVEDFEEAAARVGHPEITSAVVLTSDFPSDVRALAGALRRPFPFLGVMGSTAKIAEIRRHLVAEGFTEEDLDRLVAPVGLPMVSNTPEEIAVSIAAQLLQRRDELTLPEETME